MTDVLLDSHVLLWALADPARLSAATIDVLSDPGRTIYYSAASVWELELNASLGKLELPAGWLEAAVATGFRELPITGQHARDCARLPPHHRDPFDRMLVAQARAHQLQLATRDTLIGAYDVNVLAA